MRRVVRRASFPAALLALFLPGRGAALITIGASSPGASSSGLSVVGDLAFVAADAAGLQAIDVSNPRAPTDVSGLDTPGEAQDVEVVGDLAYVADGSGGLRLVDVSDPASPVEVGALATPGGAFDVEAAGAVAYVAAGIGGLQLIDVSDPSVPIGLGAISTTGFAQGVEVEGTLAYLADGYSGLRVIDVSDPSAPFQRGFLASGFELFVDVVVRDDLAYVLVVQGFLFPSSGSGSLVIVDVSDPAIPSVLAGIDTRPFPRSVELVGNVAYVAGESFQLVDVSNPSAPEEVGVLATRGATDVAVVAGFAYLAGIPSLRVIDLAQPAFPAPAGALATPFPHEVEVIGARAYVAEGPSGLRVFDVSDPLVPVELGGAPVEAIDVEVVGGLAYVVGSSGLHVFDVSDPALAVEVGALAVPGSRVAVEKDRAYVLDAERLHVIDVSKPASPVERGSLDFDRGGPTAMDVVGTRVYLAHRIDLLAGVSIGSLRVVDASRAAHPREIGAYGFEVGVPLDVEVVGGHAYVGLGFFGSFGLGFGYLKVLDVTREKVPLEVNSVIAPDAIIDVDVVGGLAYLVERHYGVRVFDLSNPASLGEVGAVALDDAFETDVEGGLAFVSAGESGVQILEFGPEYARVPATIDIRSGGRRNFVHPLRRGAVHVVLFGSELLNVSGVDVSTLTFGPLGTPALGRTRRGDVNRDGLEDLKLRFDKRQAGMALGDRGACVRGRRTDGALVEGCDRVQTPAPRPATP